MLELKVQMEETDQIIETVSTAKVKGTPVILNNVYAFYSKSTDSTVASNPERMVLISRAPIVEVDCDNTVTFNVGDNVYDDPTTPTGIVNKTATSRRLIGKVYESKPLGATKILIKFDGANA